MASDPFHFERNCNIVSNQISDVTPALGNLDQPMKLLVIGVRFNLKFYFNFLDVPLFVGSRSDRRSPKLDLANLRRHPERHEQASTERAKEGRHWIRRDAVVTRQPPAQITVFDLGRHRAARRLDEYITVMRRFLRWFRQRHLLAVPYSAQPSRDRNTSTNRSFKSRDSISRRQSIILN